MDEVEEKGEEEKPAKKSKKEETPVEETEEEDNPLEEDLPFNLRYIKECQRK